MPPPIPRKPDPSADDKGRNQYIPSFIANKPFYVEDDGSAADYLEHQRLQKQADDSLQNSKWYDRGLKKGPASTKFRKGACENCGSLTHKAKQCLSRPRKAGAKWTGKDIQADEVIQDVNLGWDAKRDRWNGYDVKDYDNQVKDFNDLEEMRKNKLLVAEGDRYEEETDMGREQLKGTKNLRLREDTAKYLVNLDLEKSAKYNPKTRTMIDSGPTADADEFISKSSDAADFDKAQKYAWETQERGDTNKLHLQANPTEGEFLMKKRIKETKERETSFRKALLEKYGGEEYLKSVSQKKALVTSSEKYIEYDEDGTIKGAPRLKPVSKYKEDIYLNNHTSVWGSWWHDFVWGYTCCLSTVKNSYCTGEAGKQAFHEEIRRKAGLDVNDSKAIEALPRENVDQDMKCLEIESSKRKRTMESSRDVITEKDVEEYKRKKTDVNDPMAQMLGKDKLVD